MAITNNLPYGGGGIQYIVPTEEGMLSSIPSSAFQSNGVIEKVYFPSCITIGSCAFRSCYYLTEVSFPVCKSICYSAFYGCGSLTEAYFPACTSVGDSAFLYAAGSLYLGSYSKSDIYTIFGKKNVSSTYNSAYATYIQISGIEIPAMTSLASYAFYSASKLQTVKAVNCTTIGSQALRYCSSLTEVSFPVCTTICQTAFSGCYCLTEVSFPVCKTIGDYVFNTCKSLISAYFLNSSVCTLGTGAFLSTPMSNSTYTGSFGSIYVPSSLVNSYKTATNWTAYSNRITAYTE